MREQVPLICIFFIQVFIITGHIFVEFDDVLTRVNVMLLSN